MALFVHLAAESKASLVRRTGLLRSKFRNGEEAAKGVFAMPVVPNFQVSHQWVRELRRFRGSVVGVYFRIADEEQVLCGRYNEVHTRMTAAEAHAVIRGQTGMEGFEVIILRKISAKEITRISRLPQLVGWRHYPGAHGKQPWACECCQKGEFGSRRIRERFADVSESAS